MNCLINKINFKNFNKKNKKNSLLLLFFNIKRNQFSTNSNLNSHIGNKLINFNSNDIKFTKNLNSNSILNSLTIQGLKGKLEIKIHPFINIINLPNTTTTTTTTSSSSLSSSILSSSTSNSNTILTTNPINTTNDLNSNLPLSITINDNSNKYQRAIWGLTRSLIANAIIGVSTGYTLSLRLVGVGYRATLENFNSAVNNGQIISSSRLNLKLGYAHPVFIELPLDVQASVPTSTTIILTGTDKQRLGEVAATIRNWRIPEPYNGKGIFVGDESVKRKEVKKK